MRHVFSVQRSGVLINFLATSLDLSRRAAKRKLDERCVFVNGRRIWMARHPVERGDCVEVTFRDRSAKKNEPLRRLYDGGTYIVVDKPAGRITTGTKGVEGLLRAAEKDSSWAAVHRLDRDTTGCLLLARGESARAAAVAMFRRGVVEKVYEALVRGRVSPGTVEIRTPLNGKKAVTSVSLCSSGREASHVRVRIFTGRTHQIRRHLLEIGHPVLGDRAYGTARFLPETFRSVPRPLLHASRLALPHPGAKDRIHASAPRPEDFREWLDRLGLRRGVRRDAEK